MVNDKEDAYRLKKIVRVRGSLLLLELLATDRSAYLPNPLILLARKCVVYDGKLGFGNASHAHSCNEITWRFCCCKGRL